MAVPSTMVATDAITVFLIASLFREYVTSLSSADRENVPSGNSAAKTMWKRGRTWNTRRKSMMSRISIHLISNAQFLPEAIISESISMSSISRTPKSMIVRPRLMMNCETPVISPEAIISNARSC